MRNSEDTLGSLMMPNKNSSGEISGFAAAAASAAFLSAVFLFGVPCWRPPRLSPGSDPLGIATFAFLFLPHRRGARTIQNSKWQSKSRPLRSADIAVAPHRLQRIFHHLVGLEPNRLGGGAALHGHGRMRVAGGAARGGGGHGCVGAAG